MADREKTINGLEKLREDLGYGLPDRSNVVMEYLNSLTDAIDLLKEQEAKPMTEYDNGWNCPRCGLKLIGKTASGYPYNWLDLPSDEIVKYCPVCGQEITWNGSD